MANFANKEIRTGENEKCEVMASCGKNAVV